MSATFVELVRDRLVQERIEPSPEAVANALHALGGPVGHSVVLDVYETLRREVSGAGALEPLLREPGVTDVLVNGPGAVFVDRGNGLEPRRVNLGDDAAIRRLAARLAATGGRRLDDASPYVDVRLADGTRFHAVLAPLSRPGTLLSLRVPARRTFTLAELVAAGSMSTATAEVLSRLVEVQAAALIGGGTGSGKTTLLASLLSQVNPEHRIVIVEDASELRPDHPHVVGLEARPANQEGVGLIELRTLVRQALRMRPDRLVVGEVRGAEVVDLLAALNTGHRGGFGTVHANSAADVPARIEALALAAGLPRPAVHAQLRSAIDAVIQIDRAAGVRQVREIAVPTLDAERFVQMVPAVTCAHDGSAQHGPGWPQLAELLGV